MPSPTRPRLSVAVLTEVSLFRVMFLAFTGKPPCLLACYAFVRPLQGPLERIGRWLVATGRANDARKTFPCVERVFCMPNYACLSDMFLRIEPWVDARFGFAAWNGSGSPYAGPVKQSIWLVVEKLCNMVHAIDEMRRTGLWKDTRFIGLPTDVAALCRVYSGALPPGASDRRFAAAWWPINTVMLVAIMVYSVGWAAVRVRLGQISRKHYLIGSTLALDPRLFRNLDDIVGDRSKMAIIYVLEAEVAQARKTLDTSGIAFHQLWEGRMGPWNALLWCSQTLGDYLAIAARMLGEPPRFFLQSTKLAHYRMAYRALFNCIRFDFVWGRDDHDQVHHIRSQELRRIGGKSFGINHGIPVTDLLEPGWRYIDFDIYYVFGRALYERYYTATWPAHMAVTAIGCFGLSRAELHKIRVPRTKDIVVFANPTLDNERLIASALGLARAFPDRQVFFKTKPAPKDRFFVELLANRQTPPNFHFVNAGLEATYDMLGWCGYAISTISSVGAEAVHLGLRTFILDTQPPEYPLFYREFDRLTFSEVTDVIDRIRALETGRDEYPWSAYDGLADASGQDPFDRVRADMGLPPLSPDGCIPALAATRTAPVNLAHTFQS